MSLPERRKVRDLPAVVRWGAVPTVIGLGVAGYVAGGAIVAGGGGSSAGSLPPAPSFDPPAAPTITATVPDTTQLYIDFSAFNGDGADIQDSISLTVRRLGTFDTLVHAVSGVQLRDTLAVNDSVGADSVVVVLGRQKGVGGGWSGYDSIQVTNTVPEVSAASVGCWNKPAGLSNIVNTGWDDYPASINFDTSSAAGGSSWVDIEDGDLVFEYAADHNSGYPPGIVWRESGGNGPLFYTCDYGFMLSSNWVAGPGGVSKIFFWPRDYSLGSENPVYGYLMADGSPPLNLAVNTQGMERSLSVLRIDSVLNLAPGVSEAVDTLPRGERVTIETLLDLGTSGGSWNDGSLRVWQDGVLVLHWDPFEICDNVDNACSFGYIRKDPVWGGPECCTPGVVMRQTVDSTVYSAGTETGTQLLFEQFESNASLDPGLYDFTTVTLAATTPCGMAAQGDSVLAINFSSAATTPTGWTAVRDTFPDTDSLTLSFDVCYPSGFVGSGDGFHPHQYVVVNDQESLFVGPRDTQLSLYVEPNVQGGDAESFLGIRDRLNINETYLGSLPTIVDLSDSTESRAIAGCNGDQNPWPSTDCYDAGGGTYVNGLFFRPGTPDHVFTRDEWHHVEVQWVLNTISGSVGQVDGVFRYWVDHELVEESTAVIYRTNINATLQLRQTILAPYIGSGSPESQVWYIDNWCQRTQPGPCR